MPTSSTKKKEDKKKKRKGGKKLQMKSDPIDEEEEKKLAEAFQASSFGLQASRLDRVENSFVRSAPPTCPDSPPCDGCLQPFAGTMQCSKCESVFYCGSECQASHWKATHKGECAALKELNEDRARKVLGKFESFRDWTDLDLAGAYKAAVHQGLHNKIRQVMLLDKTYLVERYRHVPVYICYTECVMNVLFRGQRAEGKARTFSPSLDSFNYMDGLRIKGYVRSHPDALDTWLQASVQVLHAAADRTSLRMPGRRSAAHNSALEVWGDWSMVFASSVASRAILTPIPSTNGSEGETAEKRRRLREDHARRVVVTLRDALHLLRVSDPGLELQLLETTVLEVAARVYVRIEESRIGINVASILNLTMGNAIVFHNVVLPAAERELEIGRSLTKQEASAHMARTLRRMKLLDI
jgi:MYND finger